MRCASSQQTEQQKIIRGVETNVQRPWEESAQQRCHPRARIFCWNAQACNSKDAREEIHHRRRLKRHYENVLLLCKVEPKIESQRQNVQVRKWRMQERVPSGSGQLQVEYGWGCTDTGREKKGSRTSRISGTRTSWNRRTKKQSAPESPIDQNE